MSTSSVVDSCSTVASLFRVLMAGVLAALIVTSMMTAASASAAPVPPEECTIQPLDEKALIRIVERSPIATPKAPVLSGTPAEPVVAVAVRETVRLSVACVNANQPMRVLALFTDGYLQRRFIADGGDDLGHLLASISRESEPAAPEDQLSLESIGEVSLLPDGRASVEVTTASAEQRFVDTVILALVDERWLIDDVLLGPPEPVATPAA